MRLRQIEVFHAVYTCGTMTSAARLLNVSQPSVSKVLAHAEQQLGYPLFERVRGKLVPTPEADRLFGLVSNVYDHVEQLRHVAENLRASDVGKIRLAATPAFGVDLLPTAVAGYLANHEDTVFEIETLHHDEISTALLESRIDIGLAFDSVAAPGLTSETLAEGEFVVIAPPDLDLGAGDRVALDALADHPFIGLSAGGPLGRQLSSYIDNLNVEFRQVVCTETYHVAKALVARGSGISIVDTITAHSGRPDEVRRWLLAPPLHYSIDVISSDSMPPSLLCRRFISHLAQTIEEFISD